VLKNRYAGKGMLVWNTELRWRVMDFSLIGHSFHVAATAFLDQGRVWRGGVRFGELLSDLHRGYGVGLHGGMGQDFVGSLYAGTSAETGLQVYVGLGYLY
jgi:hemolysin activation/secretion protein